MFCFETMDILYFVIILVLGSVCAFLLWRSGKYVSQEQHVKLIEEKQAVEIALAKIQERGELLVRENTVMLQSLEKERQERQSLERTLEGTNAYLQAQQEKFQEQKEEMTHIKQQFNVEFQVLANKILEEKSLKFTELNQQNLSLLLNPLKEKIKTFEERVEKTYNHEAAERNVLKGVVEQLMLQSNEIKNEANNLTRALRGDNKKQGNWGEVILERVLERSGLTKDQEYRLQASFTDEQGKRLQPDAIIDLPDNKHLVVDAKISLVAYERWVNAETDEDKLNYLKQHIYSIENHVKDLSVKNYQELYRIHSPDFVLLFMPIESALSTAVTSKPELFSDAWDRRVVIVSPSTLLATLRTIASMWKQERQTRNVLEIAREAGALYDKFVGFLSDMQQLETYLHKASEKHADAMKKLSTGPGNVIRKIENLKTLGAKTTKKIDDTFLS